MSKTKRDILLMTASIICSAAVMLWAGFSKADRVWLYSSLIITILILLPFYISFEKDRPVARQIVITSVMIALAVASRAAFFWVPHFKPIIAFIIIAGIALGPQKGFVTGSMSALISNFLFGQGPWTPFQMVAWGLCGLFAGVFFHRKFADGGTDKNRTENAVPLIPVLIYGALSCFVLHGAITDIWTFLSISDQPTIGGLVTVYAAGLLPDLFLACATVIFLSLAMQPMLKKIRRTFIKYGR